MGGREGGREGGGGIEEGEDPDPVFYSMWIRIRLLRDPDPGDPKIPNPDLTGSESATLFFTPRPPPSPQLYALVWQKKGFTVVS